MFRKKSAHKIPYWNNDVFILVENLWGLGYFILLIHMIYLQIWVNFHLLRLCMTDDNRKGISNYLAKIYKFLVHFLNQVIHLNP